MTLPLLTHGDLTAFSFSPSSPPSTSGFTRDPRSFPFPSSASPPPPDFPSHVSPALLSPHSAASTASIAQSISQNLGPPGSPLRPDDSTMNEADPTGRRNLGDTLNVKPNSGGDSGMDVEDELRRGPPAADIPGGDCKNVCIRHARMANGSTNLMLQKVSFLHLSLILQELTSNRCSRSKTSHRTNNKQSTRFGPCSLPPLRNVDSSSFAVSSLSPAPLSSPSYKKHSPSR